MINLYHEKINLNDLSLKKVWLRLKFIFYVFFNLLSIKIVVYTNKLYVTV